MSSIGSLPWIISGDFNSPLSEDDIINDSPISTTEYKDFDEFIGQASLCPLRGVGHYFSWHKVQGNDKTASRIDWFLGNGA